VPNGLGGLLRPIGLTFGPDGNLYVSSTTSQQVNRYNGMTGALIDAFVTPGSGGLQQPWGLTFGPDGSLYVCSTNTSQVMRYNGKTGAFMDAFVSAGSGGLYLPTALAFGPDRNLYVCSFYTNQVLRYNGKTGAFMNAFVSAIPSSPMSLLFLPPQAPSGLVAAGVVETQVRLEWVDNSDDKVVFVVQRRGPGAVWTDIQTLPADTTTFVDRGLVPGATYDYRVRAASAVGNVTRCKVSVVSATECFVMGPG
jgi:streptogramin lyase